MSAAIKQPAESATMRNLRAAWHTLSMTDLEADPPPRRYVWEPRWPFGKVCTNSGTGGTGKTTLNVGIAIARAHGVPYVDGCALTEGETVLLTAEDGIEDIALLIAAHRLEMGKAFDPEKAAGKIHVVDVSGIPGTEMVLCDSGHYVVNACVPAAIAALLAEKAPKADLLFMDTVSRFGAGESNEAHATMIKAAEMLLRLHPMTIVLNGHVSQAAARAGTTDQFAARGGAALTDNARSAITMAPLTSENIGRFAPGAYLGEDELDRFVVLTHPKSLGPKAPPLLLERCANEHGAFFRLANLRVRRAEAMPNLLAQLHALVTRLSPRVDVSKNSLKERCGDFGLGEKAMGKLVDDALADGVLKHNESRKLQGGGHPIIPGELRHRESWPDKADP
jgi:hypothetical protein